MAIRVCAVPGDHILQYNIAMSMHEMPRTALAKFLNDATGIDGGDRIISEEVESGIRHDFSDVLAFDEGRYTYTGPKVFDKAGFFAGGSYDEGKKLHLKQERLIREANSREQAAREGAFTTEESFSVLQHEITITDGGNPKPILGSFGAGPCVIIAAYNPVTNQAMLTHVDALTSLSSLDAYFDRLSPSPRAKLQVHLAGGDDSSKEQVTIILEKIYSLRDAEILSANLCCGHESKSLAIDSRTGEVFTVFHPKQLGKTEDHEFRMARVMSVGCGIASDLVESFCTPAVSPTCS